VLLFDKNGDGFVDSSEFKNEFFRLGKQELDKFNLQQKEEKARVENFKNMLIENQKAALEKFSQTKISSVWSEAQERNALKKIASIAYTYDPMKGGLEPFQMSPTISATAFRSLMRNKFELYLSAEETGALVNMFGCEKDPDNLPFDKRSIDCKEFLYQFFIIGREEKAYHFRQQKVLTLKHADQEEKRMKAAKARFATQVVAKRGVATEEDHRSVYDKIKKAAAYFKGDSVFSSNLWKSFESLELTPTEFKELLKTNFNINLSPNELDAVIKLFDTDGNGDISSIEFITTFFRIALKERSDRLDAKRVKEEHYRRAQEERARALAEELVAKNKTKIIWPDLPESEYQRTQDGTLVSGTDTLPPVSEKRKKISKPSMKELLSPAKTGSSTLKKGESLVNLFPKASDSTKDFIKGLEEKERSIRKMKSTSVFVTSKKSSKRKKKSGLKKSLNQDQEPYGDDFDQDTNLLDSHWGNGGMARDKDNFFVGDDFGTRPGTSANSSRGGESRGGKSRPNTGLTGLEGPGGGSASIVEDSTEDVVEEVDMS
jgi:hypothetical protein